MNFICPACKEISNHRDWNTVTRKHFGEDIAEVQSRDAEGGLFKCPLCGEIVNGNEILVAEDNIFA